MSNLVVTNVQVGKSPTATNNFTIRQPGTPNGTMLISVGNAGATSADVATLSITGLSITGTVTATTFSGAGTNLTGTASSLTVGNVNGGSAGYLLYQSAANTTSFVTAGSVGQYLVSNGTSAPSWQSLSLYDDILFWMEM